MELITPVFYKQKVLYNLPGSVIDSLSPPFFTSLCVWLCVCARARVFFLVVWCEIVSNVMTSVRNLFAGNRFPQETHLQGGRRTVQYFTPVRHSSSDRKLTHASGTRQYRVLTVLYIYRLRRTPSTHTLSHTSILTYKCDQKIKHTDSETHYKTCGSIPSAELHHRIIKSNVCAGMKAWTELLYWTGYRCISFVWQFHRQVIQHLSETTEQTSVPCRNGKWRTTEAIWLDHWSRVHRANRTSTNQCIL